MRGPVAESTSQPSNSHHQLLVPVLGIRPTTRGTDFGVLTALGRGGGQSEAGRLSRPGCRLVVMELEDKSRLQRLRTAIGCEPGQMSRRDLPLGPTFPSPGYDV